MQWDRGHDSGGASLLDKRRLMLAADDSQEAAIDKWEKGRVLVLCYDEARGATLLDPEGGLRVPVRSITDRHPIDGYIRSLKAETTVAMLAAGAPSKLDDGPRKPRARGAFSSLGRRDGVLEKCKKRVKGGWRASGEFILV